MVGSIPTQRYGGPTVSALTVNLHSRQSQAQRVGGEAEGQEGRWSIRLFSSARTATLVMLSQVVLPSLDLSPMASGRFGFLPARWAPGAICHLPR